MAIIIDLKEKTTLSGLLPLNTEFPDILSLNKEVGKGVLGVLRRAWVYLKVIL